VLDRWFEPVVWAWMGLAAVPCLLLLFIDAPYGRHARPGWGPTLPGRIGWILMESPSVIGMALLFLWGGHFAPTTWGFFVLWQIHYVYRAFFYPFRVSGKDRPIPAMVCGMGALFNGVNALLNGTWLFWMGNRGEAAWCLDPRLWIGIALFGLGMAINRSADRHLLALREMGEGYQVPMKGLFRWVSTPNYTGEILQWTGWAIATWSLPGLAFAVWTAANLVPRSLAHHRWYRETFPDYPPDRKALVPKLF
jgi:3-oxo-5-alpha-steroid 4-dehydrogenase 1